MRKLCVILVIQVLQLVVKCATAEFLIGVSPTPTCSNLIPQKNVNLDENLLGIWYGSHIITPSASLKSNLHRNSCVVVRIVREIDVEEDENDQIEVQHKPNSDHEILRLTVDEGEIGTDECRVQVNKSSSGNWTSTPIIGSTSNKNLCSGTIQVLKANKNVLALFFCNRNENFFTLILKRQPSLSMDGESVEIFNHFKKIWNWGEEFVIKLCDDSLLVSDDESSTSSASRISMMIFFLLYSFGIIQVFTLM